MSMPSSKDQMWSLASRPGFRVGYYESLVEAALALGAEESDRGLHGVRVVRVVAWPRLNFVSGS